MSIQASCTLIAVTGGKGGVGKSVFAANFACAMQTELRAGVLLLDCDSKSVGDQNVIMGIKPTKTMKDLANSTTSLSSQPIQQWVNAHASGVSFLGGVRGPEELFSLSPEQISKVLDYVSRHFKYIVVDIGNDLGPAQMAVIQEATAVMVVTAPEVLVVTQTIRLINDLFTATVPKDMIQLVINRVSPNSLSPQAISTQLQLSPLGSIPADEATAMGALTRFQPFTVSTPKAPISQAYFELVRRFTGGVVQRLKSLTRPKPAPAAASAASDANTGQSSPVSSKYAGMDPRNLMKIRIHDELKRNADSSLQKLLQDRNPDPDQERAARAKVTQLLSKIVDAEAPDLGRDERSKIIDEILKEALGLGPLEDLLADPATSEIMVNGYKKIFIEKGGKLQESGIRFTSNDHLRLIIERIVTPLGRQINESVPYVDARLKDGSRVNAVIEPVALDGPALTIRKFKKGGVTPEKYVEWGSMTKNMIEFLRICVESGMNVVISGGTGSGKTTLLNMLSSFIPARERIVTIEDAAELQLQQDHVVRLETRPAAMDGKNAIAIRDLIKNSLRMRPDRIVVGETRDGAALDMLQAMNTGHDGSMTTTHSNSPRECIARLETLCMMSGMDLPMKAIREQISQAVHLIVQISRLGDGSRKIMYITEVQGMQGDVVTLADIFKFKETGFDKNRKIQGVFQATGTIPNFIQKLNDKGVVIPREIFSNESKPTGSGSTGGAPGSSSGSGSGGGSPAGSPTGTPQNRPGGGGSVPPKKVG